MRKNIISPMLSEADFVALVKQGDISEVERGLKIDPSLASARAEGASALLWAVYYGHPDLARRLAAGKGSVDVFEAAALGDQHAMATLLSNRPDAANAYSEDGFTPLGLAAFFGHLEMVRMLLGAHANPNLPSKNPLGVTPLHSAMANGSKEIARTLVESGADVNAASAEGWTPLHYCAHAGDEETARYLLAKGAKADTLKSDGESPASMARAEGHSALASLLDAGV